MSNVDEIIAGIGHQTYQRVTFGAGQTSGKIGTIPLFTVTGTVSMRIIATCEVALTGASATIEVGTITNTAGIIAQTTATNLAAKEIWHDATPDATVEAETGTVSGTFRVTEDVAIKIATAAVTGGRIAFSCIWKPLYPDSYVVATVLGSASASPSPSASLSPSSSTSPSASTSISPSASTSPSSSVSPSASASVSLSPSASRSPSASASASISASPSL